MKTKLGAASAPQNSFGRGGGLITPLTPLPLDVLARKGQFYNQTKF